jgi:RHS repeat-associated protein
MFTIRREQMVVLRQQAVGEGLIETLVNSGVAATRDPGTGDVLAQGVRGRTTRFSFDESGFVGGVTSPLGRTWHLSNDPSGRLLALTGPGGSRLALDHDGAGQVSRVSRDGRPLAELVHDENGRLTQIRHPDQTQTSLGYGTSGQVALVTDRLGAREQFEHNAEGFLTAVIDGNGNRTAFEYGAWTQPDRVRHADGSTESYEYTTDGAVSRIIRAGSVAALECDDQGRPVRVSWDDGEMVALAYDDQGRLTEARNQTATVRFARDEQGRVVREEQGKQVVEYQYHEDGTLAALVYPTGERIGFDHDADGRLIAVSDWAQGLYRLTYDQGERGYVLHWPNRLTTAVDLNEVGLPAALVVSDEAASLGITSRQVRERFSLRLEYDDEDRVRQLVDSEVGARGFAYDAESRVTMVRGEAGPLERFSYDGAGNRTRAGAETATFDAMNRLVSQGATRCGYDGRGNVTTLEAPEGTWRLRYNARDQLIEASGPGGTVTFGYDALGRRVWKQSGARRVRYVWAGEHLIREETEGEAARDYLYLPGTFTPLALRVGREVYHYHTDHLGTPRRLTDATGQVVWAADPTAFGQARVRLNRVANPLRFPGQYCDEETGLHYNRFRYYAPALGRYLSRDPVTYLAGLNFYAYSHNDPVNGADPPGLWPSWKSVVSVVGAVAAGVAVGALVVVTAPVSLPAMAITAGAVLAGGAAAGAVGFGLNEGLNQEKFCLPCILKEMARGAGIGLLSALPFAFLPATAGVAAFMGAGAVSGAIGYAGNVATSPATWNWGDFAMAVGIGAATAGLGRYLGGKYSQWKAGRSSEPPPEPPANQGPPGRGYHKETVSPNPVKPENAVDEWETFLGEEPYSNRHPRTGQPDPDRLVSADGKRSIRYGDHEMNSSPNKHHYHEETWTHDPDNNVMNVDNTVRRVPLNQPKGKKP